MPKENLPTDQTEAMHKDKGMKKEAMHKDKKEAMHKDKKKMAEYKNPVKADHSDQSDKAAKGATPMVGGSKVKTGASGSNIAQSQADSGERAAPNAQKMGEFENTPGKAKGTSMKKEVKPATADGSEKSAKSPIAGK